MNHAPLLAIFNCLEWVLFGHATVPYHVINVFVHSLNAALIVRPFSRCGLSLRGSMLAGGIFAAHPANVEVAAWISRSRTLRVVVKTNSRRPIRFLHRGIPAGTRAGQDAVLVRVRALIAG